MAATERARATVHDDRLERQGPAFLWTRERALPEPGAFVVGEVAWQTPDGYAPVKRDADASAPPTPAPAGQHSTHVLITKTREGGYAIAINGETVEPDEKRKVYLTNFQGPFTVDALDKTVVGPVTIGLLAETGQRPPSNATVTIAQRAYTNDTWLEEDVLQAADLPCGSEQSATLPTVSVPFPARFTQAPFIEIQNVKAEREKQAKEMEALIYTILLKVFAFVITYAMPYFAPAALLSTNFLPSAAEAGLTNLKATASRFTSSFATMNSANTQEKLTTALAAILPILIPFLNVLGFKGAANYVYVLDKAKEKAQSEAGSLGPDAATFNYNYEKVQGALKLIPQSLLQFGGVPPTKTFRKYTIGGLTKTLKTLMAIDDASNDGQNKDKITLEDTRRFAKNEAILLEYLLEEFNPKGPRNVISKVLQFFNSGLIGQEKDVYGEAQDGLFFARIGTPRLRGLAQDTLRTDFVSTAIDIRITDTAAVWTVRIEPVNEVGFRAGYYSSGVADDVKELRATIDRFGDVHCGTVAATKVSRYMRAQFNRLAELAKESVESGAQKRAEDPSASSASSPVGDDGETKRKGISDSWEQKKINLLRFATKATHNNLCKGADKLQALLAIPLEALEEQNAGRLLVLDVPPSTSDTVVRLRPQRVRSALVTYNSTPIDKVGVSAVADNQDEFLHVFPIDAAHVSAARSLRQYGVAMRTLWALWEARTETRMLWYDAFARRDAQTGLRYDRSIGAPHTPFVSTGAFFPLAIRDRLEGCSYDYYRPELAHAVEWIATKPATTFRGTKAERAQARAPETTGTVQPTTPATLSEMVAVHVVADALIARTVARSVLPAHVRVSSNPTASLRAMLPRVLKVVEACAVDATQQGVARGVLSENDPLFVCMPGGADAARLLRYLGAWARRKDVSLAVGEPRACFGTDRTQLQHAALHNLWPAEAATQLQSTMRALGNAATLSLASMPIYALQNTLAVTLDEDPRHVNAKLAEAVASFDRTLALGAALGVYGLASNPLRLQLAAHWPVVLSMVLSAESDDAARARIAQLPLLAPLDPEPPPAMTDDDVAMMCRRNASLRIDAQHFAQGPTPAALDGACETATGEREYFVPFAHGFTPHSHVWSLEHPGSRGIDSVPVRCAFLQSALGESAQIPTEEDVVTVRCTEANYDHPFGIHVDCSNPSNQAVSCFLVAPTTGAPPRSADYGKLLGLVDAAVSLLDGAYALPGPLFADVVLWNAERLVQCALLVLGSGDGTVVPVSIACVPPPAPEARDPIEDVRAPDAQVLRVLRNTPETLVNHLKVMVVQHQEALRVLYDAAVDKKGLNTFFAQDDAEKLREEIEDPTSKSAEAYPDPHLKGTELDDAMGSLSLQTGAQPQDAQAIQAARDAFEENYRALFEGGGLIDRSLFSKEFSLDYDSETAKRTVKEWAIAKRDEVVKSVRADAVRRFSAERVEKFDAFVSEGTWNDALVAKEADERAEYIKRQRKAYFEAVEYERTEPLVAARTKQVQESEAARLRKQNVRAFYASVTLAGAMLKGLLGEEAAPRLHVLSEKRDGEDVQVPEWVGANDGSFVKGCVSAFEAALLFDQLAQV